MVFLKLQGIQALVRMEEQTISGQPLDLVDLYEPVPDFTPPRPDQIDLIVQFISEQIEAWQRPVVVTCYAGLGRTGTVLACYLVHSGDSPESAIDLVRKLRPGSIQTVEQEEAVHQFAGLLKTWEREPKGTAPQIQEEL